MELSNRQWYARGLKAGVPIGLGYLAVAFTLGIAAKNAGLTAFQATLTSFLINASAGEFVGFTLIGAGASYLEVAIMELVANARYLLMSFSLSQKLSPKTGIGHRMLIGWYVTDEVFGVSISAPGYLNPFYTYGAISLACPGWAIGTCLGVIVGNIFADSGNAADGGEAINVKAGCQLDVANNVIYNACTNAFKLSSAGNS